MNIKGNCLTSNESSCSQSLDKSYNHQRQDFYDRSQNIDKRQEGISKLPMLELDSNSSDYETIEKLTISLEKNYPGTKISSENSGDWVSDKTIINESSQGSESNTLNPSQITSNSNNSKTSKSKNAYSSPNRIHNSPSSTTRSPILKISEMSELSNNYSS